MRTAIISDTHLGAGSGADLLRREQFVETLAGALEGCDRLVLLGDTIEFRDRPVAEALAASRPLFEGIGEAMATGEVVVVPGNHDHRLLGHWLERLREGSAQVELDEIVSSPHPAVAEIERWLGEAKLTLRYPGVWVREDVFATHGHYLDSHITLPTVERLAIAAVDRMGGRPTGQRSAPQDYEKVHAPVYDLLFDLAQGGRNPQAQGKDGAPSMRLWEMIGGASGRARNWRGRALRSAVIPATLRGLERAGLGSFGRDFSIAEIGRAGVAAMHTVIERLDIEAEHVIFGHIHRRGALPGEDGRAAADPEWERRGTTLHNTGCWLYVPAMHGRSSLRSPFWPGRVTFVDDEGPPQVVELLAEAKPSDLELPPEPD